MPKLVRQLWDGRPRKLVVHVIKGEDLVGFGKSAKAKPSAVVTVGKQVRKTKPTKDNIKVDWTEVFYFVLSAKESNFSVEIRDTKRNKFMGRVQFAAAEDLVHNKVIEDWYVLEQRRPKDVVRGRILVRYYCSITDQFLGAQQPAPASYLYTKFEHRLKTGDLVLYGDHGIIDALIKTHTGAPFSSVGVVLLMPNKWHHRVEPYVVELTTNCNKKLDIVRDHAQTEGISIFHLLERFHHHHGTGIFYAPLRNPLSKENEDKMVQWVLEQHTTNVPTNLLAHLCETPCTRLLKDEGYGTRKKYGEILEYFSAEFASCVLRSALDVCRNKHPWMPSQLLLETELFYAPAQVKIVDDLEFSLSMFHEMPRIPADERSAPSSDRKEEADEGIRRPQPDETQADLMTMRSPNGNSVGGVFVSPRALEQSEISTMRPTITHPVRTEEASSSNNASPVPTATVESVEETPAMKANSLVDAHYEPDEEEKGMSHSASDADSSNDKDGEAEMVDEVDHDGSRELNPSSCDFGNDSEDETNVGLVGDLHNPSSFSSCPAPTQRFDSNSNTYIRAEEPSASDGNESLTTSPAEVFKNEHESDRTSNFLTDGLPSSYNGDQMIQSDDSVKNGYGSNPPPVSPTIMVTNGSFPSSEVNDGPPSNFNSNLPLHFGNMLQNPFCSQAFPSIVNSPMMNMNMPTSAAPGYRASVDPSMIQSMLEQMERNQKHLQEINGGMSTMRGHNLMTNSGDQSGVPAFQPQQMQRPSNNSGFSSSPYNSDQGFQSEHLQYGSGGPPMMGNESGRGHNMAPQQSVSVASATDATVFIPEHMSAQFQNQLNGNA